MITSYILFLGFLELPDNIKGMKSLEHFDLSVNPLGRYVYNTDFTSSNIKDIYLFRNLFRDSLKLISGNLF